MRLKRFTAAALAAVMCAFSLPVSAADFAEKTSDIKAYTYNITDATTIQRIAAGLKAPTEKEQNIYDLDFSGEIDIVDATIVQMHCARYYDVRSDDYLNQFATEEPTEPTTADPTEPITAEPTEPATSEPTEPITAEPTTEQPTTAVPTEPTTEESTTEAIYLRINEENVEMGLNESYTFTVETNAPSVTFMSTDESVLTVDENGTVTPKTTGEASVACDTGKGVTAWCDFKICSEAKEIKLNRSSLDLGSEEYYTFRSFVDADAAAFKRVYSSDNENVMKIDSVTGYATAIGAGKATISCTLANGLSDSCEVTVYRMAQGLTLNESSVTLALGDSFDFDSHVAGGGFAYIRVYHSLDESVVSIAPGGGIATAVGEGETQIYCELINGVRAYADVKVLPASERIKLSNAPSLMQVGEKARFRVDGNTAVNNANITVNSVNGLVRATEQGSDFIELTGIRQGVDTVTVTTYNGLSASFNVTVDGSCATLIDVSTWQGSIDFDKVKKSGIDYVILRAGYGRELDQIDNRFVENYEKAKAAGLKVGAYWFSYSESVDEAFKEAEACLYCLGGRKLDMPLYYDLEIDSVMERMTKSEYTQMALNFCSVIESAGYRPGIYSSVSVYQTKLDHSRLLRDGISVWNAHWSERCTIECDVWQYSENGSVSGIYGDVDMNLIYNLDVVE
ncbi:GH25 family lysozyme [Ruminococcus sp. JE7B6]|uniref:GH25 family lysozyme n=1 Tax=Ruminococcus sp. JE7B6 TaxID=3233380 RepID=UPI00389A2F77